MYQIYLGMSLNYYIELSYKQKIMDQEKSQNKTTFIVDRQPANISKIGNFNRSSYLHSSFVHDNLAIICQGDQLSGPYTKQLCEYIKVSLFHYLKVIVEKLKPDQKLSETVHRKKMANFLISCREEIEERKIPGYICFCFYYKVQSSIFCVRSHGLEIYVLDRSLGQIIPLVSSQNFPFTLKTNEENKGHFHVGMAKIKGQYLFEEHGQEFPLYFQKYCFDSQNENMILVLGSSECFALLTADYVKKHFKLSQKSLWTITNALLDQVKNKWRKIHQKDVTLICCYA